MPSWVRKLTRKALLALPKNVRHTLYRRLIDVSAGPLPGLTIEVARTSDDLEAALRLAHDAYVKAEMMPAMPSGMRISEFHALPTSSVVVAKLDGRVVGTYSMVRDGELGLPTDAHHDLSALRANGATLAEMTTLAVAHDVRGGNGRVLLALMKFLYNYASDFCGTDTIVLSVQPHHRDLYEAIILADPLPGIGRINLGSRDLHTSTYVLDLRSAPDRYFKMYGHRDHRRNVFRFMTKSALGGIDFAGLKFPDRRYTHQLDPTPVNSLLVRDMRKSAQPRRKSTRVFMRVDAKLNGRDVRLLNVSADGVQVAAALTLGDTVALECHLNATTRATIHGHVVWATAHRAGVKLTETDDHWAEFALHLLAQST